LHLNVLVRSVKNRPTAVVLYLLIAIWLGCAAVAFSILWRYDNTPGAAATATPGWPAPSGLQRAVDRPTLVMLAHPQCSCTQASLGELAEVLARSDVHPRTYVVFLRPSSFGDGWEKSSLWRTAERLPAVTLVRDDDGREARSFGGATSGQTFLYGADGALIFSGGITGSRAHEGDNVGRRSLVALLNREHSVDPRTNVFGCPLFASGT
jgi:hypothetical protein